MRYMLYKQAVSLNCVDYYYTSVSIAHLTHDYHFSILIAMFAALLSSVYVGNGKC